MPNFRHTSHINRDRRRVRRARVLILPCKIASLQNFVVPKGRGGILFRGKQ